MTEILLVFILALAAGLILWCLMGLLLLPVFGERMVTFCFSEGDGGELEQRVRGYGWFREGNAAGGRMVILDCGLNAQGLSRALLLREKYEWVEYCPRAFVEDYMELLQDSI